jgi:mono/diheme cytochrome c family protein
MTRRTRAAVAIAAGLVLAVIGLYAFVRGHGFNARAEPGAFESAVAGRIRSLAIPPAARDRTNPVPASEEIVREGLAHFADHCAFCHGNDGSGDSDIGRGLYPKPPDMRQSATQQLTDGELFYIIENGVPLTGMPAFGTGEKDGEDGSWHLVHFIRRLPSLTQEELEHMAELNPISADEWRQRMEEQGAMKGGAPNSSRPTHKHSGHKH